MKKFWTRWLSVALMGGGMLAALSGCSDDDDSSGGGSDKYDAFPHAAGVYMGDDLELGIGHYSVVLHSEGITLDESFYFEGTGDGVWLEMYAPLSADARHSVLEPGTYNPVATEEEVEEFTFVTATGDMPSFLVSCVEGEETDDMLVGGEVVVERKGDGYLIKMTVTSEGGVEKSFKYEGKISFFPMVAYGPDAFGGTFVGARANYFDDFYGKGIGNFEFALTDIADEETKMGHTLYLDLNTTKFASQAAITLVPGTYTCDKTASATTVSTFNAGSDNGEYYSGSVWVETDSDGGERVLKVTDGTCVIAREGLQYEVSVDVVLDNGETRTGRFAGRIGLSDESCLTRLGGNVSSVFSKGMAIFYGDAQYYQSNSYNWTIRLATAGIDLYSLTGNGEMVQLVINTTRDSKTEIPTGDYQVIEAIHTDYLVPFTYVPGYVDNLRGLSGSWYTEDLMALGPCISGTLHIENKGGGDYAFRYDFVDDYHYTAEPHSITGTYEGRLEYIDDSQFEENAAPAKNGKARKSISQAKSRLAKAVHLLRPEVRR